MMSIRASESDRPFHFAKPPGDPSSVAADEWSDPSSCGRRSMEATVELDDRTGETNTGR